MNTLRYIVMTFLSMFFVTSLSAQTAGRGVLPVFSLEEFTSLRVDADIDLTLVALSGDELPKIVYDMRDSDPAKFRFGVKESGELQVMLGQRVKGIERVKATLYYHNLSAIKVSRADVKFESPLRSSIVDIILDSGAKLSGDVDCDDLDITLSSGSRLDIDGVSHYLKLRASSNSKADLRGVAIRSATIETLQSAIVALNAGERLKVNASTKSVVKYWGRPQILRSRKPLLGGEIIYQGE